MKRALLLLTLLAAAALAQPSAPIKDARDGKTYKTVKIGAQSWMAENLNYNAKGSECYSKKAANCAKHGRLYDWETALKACPEGWYLPSMAEWNALYKYADSNYADKDYNARNGYSEIAGKYLKAKNGWKDFEGKSGSGEDKFGFAALPGGIYDLDASFIDAGEEGYWWSASEENSERAYHSEIRGFSDGAFWGNTEKGNLFSVRCLRD